MASSDPTTWISPLKSGSASVDKIFQDLTEWLAKRQIQVGTFSATIPNGSSFVNPAVTFAAPFQTATDGVFVALLGGGNFSGNPLSVTNSGFTASVFTTTGTNVVGATALTYYYLAVGH